MKLATYNDGSRDGQLLVVSSDLALAHYASHIAPRLQSVLDDWNFVSPQLEDLARTLNQGKARHAFPFDPRQCMAPLPRAYQRVDAFVHPNRDRLRLDGGPAPGREPAPLLRQARSDDFLGPHADIVATDAAGEIDFGAGLAVVTSDLRRGCTAAAAIEGVRLLLLANDITLQDQLGDELEHGAGLLHSHPATAFAALAVTPDELGAGWHAGRARLSLECRVNAEPIAHRDVAAAMPFDFGALMAHLCRTRSLRAGSIVGAGGAPCIAEQRVLQSCSGAAPTTQFLQPGDTIRIEARDAAGHDVFGAIEQRVQGAEPAAGR